MIVDNVTTRICTESEKKNFRFPGKKWNICLANILENTTFPPKESLKSCPNLLKDLNF